MTVSTVGYGDLVPQSTAERIYVIVGLFVGTAFFSYVVGTVCGARPAPIARHARHARAAREPTANS